MKTVVSLRCPLIVTAFVACIVLVRAEPATESATLERIERLEKQLALVERKFALVGAKDERELNNSGTVFGSAALLLEQARYELETTKNLPKAYRYLADLHALHSESPEDAEAFSMAASLFQRLYFQNRHSHPDSIWMTSEPIFMFQWLASFCDDDSFSQSHLDSLFRGMPYDFSRDFTAFTLRSHKLSRWTLRVQEDNGIIESVDAIPKNISAD